MIYSNTTINTMQNWRMEEIRTDARADREPNKV